MVESTKDDSMSYISAHSDAQGMQEVTSYRMGQSVHSTYVLCDKFPFNIP